MWLFAMFDLPVTTPKAREGYAAFRKLLYGRLLDVTILRVRTHLRQRRNGRRTPRPRPRCFPSEGYVRSWPLRTGSSEKWRATLEN